MTASLTIEPRPDLGDGVRYYQIDYAHGTSGAFTDGPALSPDSMIVAVLLERHEAAGGCDCTAALPQRYG